jgi:hypothetical protein
MDLFSFLSLHFMCVIVTVVIGHSMALSRRSHLFSTISSLHDVLMHDTFLRHFSMKVIDNCLKLTLSIIGSSTLSISQQ